MYYVSISGGTPLYRSGLEGVFARYFPDTQVTRAETIGTITERKSAHNYQLRIIVMDRNPPTQAFERITPHLSKGNHLLIGDHVSLRLFKRLLATGLRGYVLRNVAVEQLREAITEVLAGRPYVDPTLKSNWLAQQLGQDAETHVDPLTKRERQVLRLIVMEHTSDEIASKLFIGRCTVETHRAHLLHKLGVRNTAGIVREAMRRDLCAI
jgi:DNA-binding NarL/FixJ family response regulator